MPIFEPQHLQRAVADALQASEIGAARHAFVVVVTSEGVKGVLTTKLDEHWQVSGVFGVDHERRIAGGVEVKATW